MTQLTSDHISHLAGLARLELTSEEEVRFASQLSPVVQYVEQLAEVDTSHIREIQGASGMHNVFVEDELRAEDDLCNVSKADLLAGVPATQGDFIEVRAVMADEIVGA